MPEDRRAVRETFERIADHFAETREHPWPEVTEFLDGRSGSVGLDLGCANGRHLVPLAERVDRALGVDPARRLLRHALDRAGRTTGDRPDVAVLQGDAGRLPLRDGVVDLAVYVATLHHLPARAARVDSLAELARVLAPNAPALVSAWAVEHDRFDETEAFDTHLDWTLPDGTVVTRFYHVYDRDGFERDLSESPLAVESVRLSAGNYYAVVSGPR